MVWTTDSLTAHSFEGEKNALYWSIYQSVANELQHKLDTCRSITWVIRICFTMNCQEIEQDAALTCFQSDLLFVKQSEESNQPSASVKELAFSSQGQEVPELGLVRPDFHHLCSQGFCPTVQALHDQPLQCAWTRQLAVYPLEERIEVVCKVPHVPLQELGQNYLPLACHHNWCLQVLHFGSSQLIHNILRRIYP